MYTCGLFLAEIRQSLESKTERVRVIKERLSKSDRERERLLKVIFQKFIWETNASKSKDLLGNGP